MSFETLRWSEKTFIKTYYLLSYLFSKKVIIIKYSNINIKWNAVIQFLIYIKVIAKYDTLFKI